MLKSNLYPATRAAVWMAGSLASFIAMAIAGRQLSSSLDTFEILFFRSLCSLAIISILLWRTGWRQVLTRRLGLHMLRNVSHFGGQFGWFYGLAFIPMAEVFAIEFTTPVWTAIVAALILGERLTLARVVAVVLGLIGVLVIVRPGSGVVHPAALAVLLGAIAYAFAHTMTKKLAPTESPLCILFYMTVIQLPLGLLPSLSDFSIPSAAAWPYIFILGASALSGHYCLTKALMLADVTVVVPMDFLRLPLIAVIGAVFYAEQIQPAVFVGALLIVGGNLFSLYAERKGHALQAAIKESG